MRNFIWLIIKKYLSKELSLYSDSLKDEHYRELDKVHAAKRTYSNYPIGKKVIVRSNEPDPLFIGTVTGYWIHENSKVVFLNITDELGREISPMDNAPAYWSQEREDALNKLSWDEQWNCLSKYHCITLETKLAKEDPKYQEESIKFKEYMKTLAK